MKNSNVIWSWYLTLYPIIFGVLWSWVLFFSFEIKGFMILTTLYLFFSFTCIYDIRKMKEQGTYTLKLGVKNG